MKPSFLSLGVFLLFALIPDLKSADNIPDLNNYKDLSNIEKSGLVYEDSFDRGLKGWMKQKQFKIIPGAGINGTSALFYERTNPKEYILFTKEIKLRSDRMYRVTFSVKLQGLKRHGAPSRGEFGAVEYSRKGRYLGGGYSNNKKYDLESEDWQKVDFVFQPKKGVEKAYIRLYLQREYTGRIWWDNLKIQEVGALTAVIHNVTPKCLQLDDSGKLAFGATFYSNPKPQNIVMLVEAAGTRKIFKGKNRVFSGEIGKLPYGEIKVKTTLLDLDQKTILAKHEYIYFHREKPIPPKGASSIDKYNRTIVDGKPFLPIGMFGHSMSEKQMKQFSEAGLNCFLSYWAMFMCLDGKQKRDFKNVDQCMDMFKKYKIKVIFSIKDQLPTLPLAIHEYQGIKGLDNISAAMVKRYKNHPALLAWYISDENPRSEIPQIQKLRELVNRIDPNHFTVTLTWNSTDFPYFASSGDVLLIDVYPIVKNKKTQGMQKVTDTLQAADGLNMPLWFAPQGFNYGLEKAKPNTPQYKEYRWPTADEIKSMALAGAVHGAKGFFFYSHSLIFKYGEKFEPGSSKRTFANVVEAVKLLKELEPFLLSTRKAPEVTILSSVAGKIEVAGWNSENNQVRIAVIGVQGGNNEGVFLIKGHQNLKSKYGLTRNLGGGKYQFKGKNICSDILY